MSCAACSARVEKAVSKVPGVTSCSVSLLTNSMGVEGTASAADIIKAVENAGYGAAARGGAGSSDAAGAAGGASDGYAAAARLREQEEALRDTETPRLKKRLLTSLCFLVVLMYFSMGHMMLGWPVPALFENHVALALFEMLIALIIMTINGKFFTSGFKSLAHGAPNMDTLVALGSAASFGYSLVELFIMIDAMGKGDSATVHKFAMDLYFESAAMIPTLITVGKLLEAMSKGRTTDALKGLMQLAPKTAVVLRDGNETEVPIEEVRTGDLFVVRPGENIPVDGVIVDGESAINEAALTGESIPVDKAAGDTVQAATVNQSGFLTCRATRVGEDTTLAQIIKMVSDAAATKAPLARIADKVSAIFVPTVIGLAILTMAAWLLLGKEFGFAIARGISVLVISCPCALGLATPVAIMVGNGMGAKNGILYKTAQSLEETGRVDTVVLDKTGTITAGEPKVTDILPAEGVAEEVLLTAAAALEQKSEHPLAKAVMDYWETKAPAAGAAEDGAAGAATDAHMPAPEVSGFKALPGNGLTAVLEDDPFDLYDGAVLTGGNRAFIEQQLTPADKELLAGPDQTGAAATEAGASDPEPKAAGAAGGFAQKAAAFAEQGKTPLYFAADGRFLGIIAVADVMKEESPQAIRELRNMGIRVVMLTGDNERTAKAVGAAAGVDDVAAGVLPDGKEAVIRELQKDGKVAMVGDGINDAPALTRADIGIAIGAGTDVAIDAADVVLMKSRLTDVPAAIRMSRQTIRNIHENLFWAFFYNAICIPLAMGVYGIAMKPMYGAAAMALSSFFVCMNALRLNLFNMHDASKDKPHRKKAVKAAAGAESAGAPEADAAAEAAAPEAGAAGADFEMPGTGDSAELQKTMHIEGMMCEHCEARVRKALEALDGVTGAEVSHEAGTAVVNMTAEIDHQVLKDAVEAEDYQVISIEDAAEGAEKETTMKKTMNIEGMMCMHCEATVKKALEALDGVTEAVVSHEAGTAVVEMTEDIDNEVLKKAVEDKDYAVKGIA